MLSFLVVLFCSILMVFYSALGFCSPVVESSYFNSPQQCSAALQVPSWAPDYMTCLKQRKADERTGFNPELNGAVGVLF